MVWFVVILPRACWSASGIEPGSKLHSDPASDVRAGLLRARACKYSKPGLKIFRAGPGRLEGFEPCPHIITSAIDCPCCLQVSRSCRIAHARRSLELGESHWSMPR